MSFSIYFFFVKKKENINDFKCVMKGKKFLTTIKVKTKWCFLVLIKKYVGILIPKSIVNKLIL